MKRNQKENKTRQTIDGLTKEQHDQIAQYDCGIVFLTFLMLIIFFITIYILWK